MAGLRLHLPPLPSLEEVAVSDQVAPAPDKLARPVLSEADVAGLGPEDRMRLAHWLVETGPVRPAGPALRKRRRRVLVSASAAAVFLLPWVAFLATTLPQREQTHGWRIAWVGFDVALLLGFAATAWLGWKNRQLVTTALVVTATLTLCDVWFDLTLSWGTSEQAASVVTAVIAEIPFGLFLVVTYRRLLRALGHRIWQSQGEAGAPPSLWRQRLLLLPHEPHPSPPVPAVPAAPPAPKGDPPA